MLNVSLENDVKDKHDRYEGIYIFQGLHQGMDYWVDTQGEKAIWYSEWYETYGNNVNYEWSFGALANTGHWTGWSSMYWDREIYSSSNILKRKCPNNEGYIWNWKYIDGSSWFNTNDVYVKCVDEDDFCTSENRCGSDQGDCDTHNECQTGLSCGSNNCPESVLFNSDMDCCYSRCKIH